MMTRAMAVLAMVLMAWPVWAQGVDAPVSPDRVYAPRNPYGWFSRNRQWAPDPAPGIRPEHRVAPGDESAPGVTPRCRQFWVSASPQFTTTAGPWTDEWAHFHALCDGGRE
jgi:hypothetical protein